MSKDIRLVFVVLIAAASDQVLLTMYAQARTPASPLPRDHHAVRAPSAEPIDDNDPDLPTRVRELALNGLDAVLDHAGVTRSLTPGNCRRRPAARRLVWQRLHQGQHRRIRPQPQPEPRK